MNETNPEEPELDDADLMPDGYIDDLLAELATLPDAVEAPGEDPEPMI
jgi:hypothetical protein